MRFRLRTLLIVLAVVLTLMVFGLDSLLTVVIVGGISVAFAALCLFVPLGLALAIKDCDEFVTRIISRK
jgi:hypothetical protein